MIGDGRGLARRSAGVWLALVVPFCVLGCEWSLPDGPSAYPTVRMVGKITLGGQPVRGGWVTVLPFGGAVGDHAIGRIMADGTFSIDRSPVGRLAVKVSIPEGALPPGMAAQPAVLARLRQFRGPASPLRTKTEPKAVGRFEVDLLRDPIGRTLARPG